MSAVSVASTAEEQTSYRHSRFARGDGTQLIFRMKTVDGAREDVELGVSLFREVVSQCCLEVEGFRAGYFLVDRERGKTVTLTLWDDREALSEGVENRVRRLGGDEQAAATVARVNSHGVSFDPSSSPTGSLPIPRPSGRSEASSSSPVRLVRLS